MSWNVFMDVLKESLEVCMLVMLMMSLVEALDLGHNSSFHKVFRKSRVGQVGLGALIGAIPGCVGGFAVTSLYNRGLVSFGALVAMMVASSGDEAFVMLSMFPRKAVMVICLLVCIAFVAGLLVDIAGIRDRSHVDAADEDEAQGRKRTLRSFLVDDVLKHVVLKHLPRVFAWTFGILFVLALLESYVDVAAWINDKTALMIILAALVGIIPESGPHLVFVTLFANGVLPLPVLLASCISQDGHSGLALLAENKRSFFLGKAINVALAIVVGFVSMWVMG